jgi:hypothetical protein
MTAYAVKWMVDGEMTIEANSLDEAERMAQEKLVAALADPANWPAELGTRGIQGAAQPVSAAA